MYREFASVYDRLMDDFDYPAWAEYYLSLLTEQGMNTPCEIAECGCGTGSLSIELSRRGCSVLASDVSEDMLRVASEKARRAGQRVRFVRQDMRRLTLPHRVDAVVCACDGVNYLTQPEQVTAFFRAAYAALKPGGVLAFDVSSAYKLEHVLANDFFGEERADVAYLWQNAYNPETRLITLRLTFFVREQGDTYRRFEEVQTQRAHSLDELLSLLTKCGFERATVYGDRTRELPRADELRWHFTARVPG